MSRFRQPEGPPPCPVHILFPPEPGSANDAAALAAWSRARVAWHKENAIAGASELGTAVSLLRARQAARMLFLAHRGQLDPRMAIPLPECWARRWAERPPWLSRLEAPPDAGLHVVPLKRPVS